jgi:hypothetical protein
MAAGGDGLDGNGRDINGLDENGNGWQPTTTWLQMTKAWQLMIVSIPKGGQQGGR